MVAILTSGDAGERERERQGRLFASEDYSRPYCVCLSGLSRAAPEIESAAERRMENANSTSFENENRDWKFLKCHSVRL